MSPLRIVLVLAAAALLTAAAPPEPTPRQSGWAQQPTGAQRQAALIAAGVKPGETGVGVIVCKAMADGGLEACRVAVDNPASGGFAKAALALAPLYRVTLAPPRLTVGSDVIVTVDNYRLDTPPDWLRKPTPRDLMTVYPTEALRLAKEGDATISCMLSVQGALYDCHAVTESPAGEHFGDAAVALSPQFLMKPGMFQGQPAVSTVNIPIAFRVPKGTRPQPEVRRPDLDRNKGLVSPAMAWLEAPSYASVVAAYPAKAMAEGLGGRATLNCEFAGDGRLRDCTTITEQPTQRGFGRAAQELAKQFRAEPTLGDGRPIKGVSVQMPFVFDAKMMQASNPIIGKAQWAALPNAEETSAAFGKLKIDGVAHVRMGCRVVQGGGVTDCRLDDSLPVSPELGAAALSLAPHFKLTTWTIEGLPTVGGTITIPIRYELKDPQPAPKG